jgi:hypothetical protein
MIFRAFANQEFTMRKYAIALVGLTTMYLTSPAVADASNKQSTAASEPDQEIKCRKVEVTGSLVKKGKVCKTVAEWKVIQNNGNRTARAIVESGNICAGGQCAGN